MLGEMRWSEGQRFRCVELRPHRRLDGTATRLVVWEADCATCRQPFRMTTPEQAPHFHPTRRCPEDARKGKPIKAIMERRRNG